ncbi:hypothetical protein AM588_10006529 [Phytophthora nicotianae]|uniref:Uncharacterized protein n=1 Tax=Phytophthora nicotianae TaxID=4792 RepID=A0A0W8D8A2_PHYNI|nr:hypothetical protein AM588_10006529 [Phytophthora nicotianae]
MVRKKRKGVIKEAQAGGIVAPNGVDLRLVLKGVPVNVELPAALGGGDLAAWYEALCAAHCSLYEQLKKLQLFRSKYAQRSGQWLGGITYYSDVFAPLFGLLAAGVAVMTSCSLADELQSLTDRVRELAQEACDIHNQDDVTHPLMLRSLELLANKDNKTSTPTDVEPVRELLYLTPYWTALAESWTA